MQASGAPVHRGGAMDLAERRRGGGLQVEGAEAAPPVGPELGLHAALHEGRAHGRRLALQLLQLGRVFRRDRDPESVARSCATFMIGPLRPPSACGERRGVRGVLPVPAEQASARHAGRHPADIGADAGIAGRAGGKAVRFAVGFGHGEVLSAGSVVSFR